MHMCGRLSSAEHLELTVQAYFDVRAGNALSNFLLEGVSYLAFSSGELHSEVCIAAVDAEVRTLWIRSG